MTDIIPTIHPLPGTTVAVDPRRRIYWPAAPSDADRTEALRILLAAAEAGERAPVLVTEDGTPLAPPAYRPMP